MTRTERIEKVKRALLAMQRFAWEQGMAAQAFLELGEQEWVILLAREAVNRQHRDGRLAFMGEPSVSDPACNGEAVFFAARITGEPRMQQAADDMLAWLLHRAPRNADGILYHLSDRQQVWVDSFYMAPPFLALEGYPEKALKQIEGYRTLLWNPEKKLYSHMWDDKTNDFARKDFWGVGNGWAAAGMARVLKMLPDHMAEVKSRLAGYVREVLDGCLAYQQTDGFFHDVVDRPETFVEVNLAQMLSYTIYRGVTAGWLDSEYVVQADRMRQAVYAKVDEFGLVQDVCGAPRFDHPGTAPEGQAFFLLMEAAALDYERHQSCC